MQWDAIYVILGVIIGVGMMCGVIALCGLVADRTKVAAGQLIHSIREPWRAPQEHGFQDFLIAMKENRIEGGHTRLVSPFLERMNEIAIYWQIGALTERDIQEFFGNDIKNLQNNAYLQDILTNHYEQKSYTNLKELLEKAKDW